MLLNLRSACVDTCIATVHKARSNEAICLIKARHIRISNVMCDIGVWQKCY